MQAWTRQLARRRLKNIAQHIAETRSAINSMRSDQSSPSGARERCTHLNTPQHTSPDAPYATLHKHLDAKRGTVHASYLYEAHALFMETGTTLLPAAPPASSMVPGHRASTTAHGSDQAAPRDPSAPHASKGVHLANNVVAAPHLTTTPHPHGSIIPIDYRDGDGTDPRPILLFDLNGTITSHTAKRRSSGINRPRPGIQHLRRLQVRHHGVSSSSTPPFLYTQPALGPSHSTQPHYRLGVFTSSTWRTVQTAVAMLEKAAGLGPPLFAEPGLILHRANTMQVPAHHVTQGGKAWDTVKPLHPYFRRLDRVLLLDDDGFKVGSSPTTLCDSQVVAYDCSRNDCCDTMHTDMTNSPVRLWMASKPTWWSCPSGTRTPRTLSCTFWSTCCWDSCPIATGTSACCPRRCRNRCGCAAVAQRLMRHSRQPSQRMPPWQTTCDQYWVLMMCIDVGNASVFIWLACWVSH